MPYLFKRPHERVAPAAATNMRRKPRQAAQDHAENSHDHDQRQDLTHAIERSSLNDR